MRLALLTCLSAIALQADPLDSWSVIEPDLFQHGRLSAVLHTQFRVRTGLHDFYAWRAGPVLRFAAHERVDVIAGYYFAEQEQDIRDWGATHRYFGGIQTELRSGRTRVTARTLLEHRFSRWTPDQAVLRQNLRLEHPGRLTPVVGVETMFDQNGFFTQRFLGGVRFRLGEHARPEVQYHYDIRRTEAGGNRHVITTTVRLANPRTWF